MNLKSFLLIGALCLTLIPEASAQTQTEGNYVIDDTKANIPIDEIALKILTESPGFSVDYYSLQSLYANLKTSSNLPDPELGGEYLIMPEDVDNRWTTEISWGVEWPGVYGARGKESKEKMNAADKAVYSQRVEKVAEIKNLLIDYIQCRLKFLLLDELDRNNEKIYRLAEAAGNNSEITLIDLNKIKIEYANIKGMKSALLEEEATVISDLSAIYGKDCYGLLQLMECSFPRIKIPSSQEVAMIKENAPSVQAAIADAQAVRQSKKVLKMEALPSLSVGYKHQYEDGMHFNGAVLGVSIPIFSSRGKQKAVDADIIEAEFKVESELLTIQTEAELLLKRLTLLNARIEEISPLVENFDYANVLLKAYEEGLISLLDYITEMNYFTNAAVDLVNLRTSAAKTNALLQKYLISYSF